MRRSFGLILKHSVALFQNETIIQYPSLSTESIKKRLRFLRRLSHLDLRSLTDARAPSAPRNLEPAFHHINKLLLRVDVELLVDMICVGFHRMGRQDELVSNVVLIATSSEHHENA